MSIHYSLVKEEVNDAATSESPSKVKVVPFSGATLISFLEYYVLCYLDNKSVAQCRLACKSWKSGLQWTWLLRELKKYKIDTLCFLGRLNTDKVKIGTCCLKIDWKLLVNDYKNLASIEELSALQSAVNHYYNENAYELFKRNDGNIPTYCGDSNFCQTLQRTLPKLVLHEESIAE